MPTVAARKNSKRRRNESTAEKQKRAARILARLRKDFPRASTALKHGNPFQLLIATILSAQCTDERVNMVTPGLFVKYPSASHFANASQEELEREIRSTGFFRMKARNIIGCCTALLERHGGEVPANIEELVMLPGVGRKTANVVLGQAFGITSGVVVDTHVHRLAQRLGLSEADLPEKIEQDLMHLINKENWIDTGSLLILHGRKTCVARNPKCPGCCINDICPSAVLA